jgi:hypothetical protein
MSGAGWLGSVGCLLLFSKFDLKLLSFESKKSTRFFDLLFLLDFDVSVVV